MHDQCFANPVRWSAVVTPLLPFDTWCRKTMPCSIQSSRMIAGAINSWFRIFTVLVCTRYIIHSKMPVLIDTRWDNSLIAFFR
jgi:hypothetical protein